MKLQWNAKKIVALLGASVIAAVTLSACAGGVTPASEADQGEGFDFAADQSVVDTLVEDLEPVTITYQPTTSGPQSSSAHVDTAFAEEIERRSNGKITVEIAWGQAIAGYDEIDDALADGRLDIGRTIPSYHPQQYPTFSAIDALLSNLKSSPHVAEVAANAVGMDLGWGSDALLAEFEGQQLTPVIPLFVQAGNYMVCSSEGSSADDFKGRQVRIASESIAKQVGAIGATPVSLDYTEVFEGLQRGTIDCTAGKLASLAETGVLEVAPHVSYPSTVSFAKAPSAIVAGSSVRKLPLAYQQIIFDSQSAFFAASMTDAVGNATGIKAALEYGGEVEPFDDDVDSMIAGANEALLQGVVESGLLGDDPLGELRSAEEAWTATAQEYGLSDDGDFADLPDWYDDSFDYRPFVDSVVAELAVPYRPGA